MKHPFELKIKGDQKGRLPNVYITSDLHYGHKNICRGTTTWRTADGQIPINSTRNFSSLEKMNYEILNGINTTVSQDDILIILGDVGFGGADSVHKLLSQIVCKNLYLCYGNHDAEIADNELDLQNRFLGCYSYMKLSVGNKRFILQHYPIASWHGLNKGWYMLFGHVHLPTNRRFGPGRTMDVGIDGHPEFRPYNIITEVVPLLEKREIKSWFSSGDHHVNQD